MQNGFLKIALHGTLVEFYSNSDSGPLGKPVAKKISTYEELRGWDPTDPDQANPWKKQENSTNINNVDIDNTRTQNTKADNNIINKY